MQGGPTAHVGDPIVGDGVDTAAARLVLRPPDALDHRHAGAGVVGHGRTEAGRAATASHLYQIALADSARPRVLRVEEDGRSMLAPAHLGRLAEGGIQEEPVGRHDALERILTGYRLVLGPFHEGRPRRQRRQPLTRRSEEYTSE